jgi:UPF0122 protein GWCH70_1086
MNNIQKKDYYNFLYSYYQNLLTDKQRIVFENYYYEDYSLSEIAESLHVSRNAIWDLLKKVEHNLDEYEAKLHLFHQDKKLNEYLNELEKHLDEEGKKILNKIKEME